MAQSGGDAGAKALYAAGALTRNNVAAQAAFRKAGGAQALQHILGGACSVRLQRKAVALALDLAQPSAEEGRHVGVRVCVCVSDVLVRP